MSIAFKCSCGKKLRMSDNLAGKKVRCPDCKSAIELPLADEDDADVIKAEPRQAAKVRSRDRDEDEDRLKRKRKIVHEDNDEGEDEADHESPKAVAAAIGPLYLA
jgi:hypothetical protein